jgi:hypothetical protein
MATTISEKIGQCETPKNRKEPNQASVVGGQPFGEASDDAF